MESPDMDQENGTLYDRMGGAEGVASMVDEFYGRVLSDPILKPHFEGVPMDRLTKMQEEFFSSAMGGPIVYTGRPLSQVHAHLEISQKEFQQFTEHLIATLEEKGVSQQEILDLISKVNLSADEIIDRSNIDG